MMKMNKAVFLDRDGTINLDKGYVFKVDDFIFFPGVIDTLKEIKEKGYLLVLITNQSGIARGYFSEEDFINLTEWMDWSLADRGVDLDGIYYCPHHEEGLVDEFAIKCDCRKPNDGMIKTAQKELNIDLNISFIVGDKVSDMMTGKKAGIKERYLIQWPDQVKFDLNQNKVKVNDKHKDDLKEDDYYMITNLKELLKKL
ncbi:D-glycero-beta-D-manno-heptose 1,7-bisphosphate 7-phosphatase [Thorsellia kenyensis]|uniref:D,D-heptose 1,7-bisphosphate phosphatase n=1 Tax=Thorsellia kenyensis TaxID=1549888 RepID=A0ABV6C8V2_9GAMM